MTLLQQTLSFALICLASYVVGKGFKQVRLPAITGYLLTGALAGPFALGLLEEDTSADLRFVDEISLAVIALVAGSELLVRQLRPRLRAIGATVVAIIFFGYLVLATAIYLLAPFISFTAGFSTGPRLALALLGSAVLLALSPPSTIAVIKEVQARGRFTRTILGVTVLMDVAIIVLFAAVTSIASPLLQDTSLDLSFLGLLAIDLALAVGLGVGLGLIIQRLLGLKAFNPLIKTGVILALGFGVYELAGAVRAWSSGSLGFEVYIEPLLISLIGAIYVANFTPQRNQLDSLLHDVSPLVYVAFFTITGVSLKLDLLQAVLPIALALFVIRAAGIAMGTYVSSKTLGEPETYRRYSWMAFITQAGIALGLAREVAVQFPALGDAFATLVVSVVVINEVFGPLFLKGALRRVGEANEPDQQSLHGGRVLVFGVESHSAELGRALSAEGLSVTLVGVEADRAANSGQDLYEEVFVDSIDSQSLQELFAEPVGGVVAMLDDDDTNEEILRFAAERHGVGRLVVRPGSVTEKPRFEDLGALIVHPSTAIVSLLAQGLLAPGAASLLLNQQSGREVLQIEVTNQELDGIRVRDLPLPPEVLLVEIERNRSVLLVTGQTRLRPGDEITLIAEVESEAAIRMLLQDRAATPQVGPISTPS